MSEQKDVASAVPTTGAAQAQAELAFISKYFEALPLAVRFTPEKGRFVVATAPIEEYARTHYRTGGFTLFPDCCCVGCSETLSCSARSATPKGCTILSKSACATCAFAMRRPQHRLRLRLRLRLLPRLLLLRTPPLRPLLPPRLRLLLRTPKKAKWQRTKARNRPLLLLLLVRLLPLLQLRAVPGMRGRVRVL
jgi:hypothetical protein